MLTSIQSLSFCMRIYNASLTNYQEECRSNVAKWAPAFLNLTPVWVTIVLQIHSSVTWPYAPHTSHVTTAATYKKWQPVETSNPFSLITEGYRSMRTRLCDLCELSYGPMVRHKGLYENNRTIGICKIQDSENGAWIQSLIFDHPKVPWPKSMRDVK
jgi:hypothetical protein